MRAIVKIARSGHVGIDFGRRARRRRIGLLDSDLFLKSFGPEHIQHFCELVDFAGGSGTDKFADFGGSFLGGEVVERGHEMGEGVLKIVRLRGGRRREGTRCDLRGNLGGSSLDFVVELVEHAEVLGLRILDPLEGIDDEFGDVSLLDLVWLFLDLIGLRDDFDGFRISHQRRNIGFGEGIECAESDSEKHIFELARQDFDPNFHRAFVSGIVRSRLVFDRFYADKIHDFFVVGIIQESCVDRKTAEIEFGNM